LVKRLKARGALYLPRMSAPARFALSAGEVTTPARAGPLSSWRCRSPYLDRVRFRGPLSDCPHLRSPMPLAATAITSSLPCLLLAHGCLAGLAC
jgi:hypothetical protein